MKLRENKQQANESIASQGLTNITKNLLSCESSSWIRVKHLLYKILCIIRNLRPWISLEINHRPNNCLGYSLFSLCTYSVEFQAITEKAVSKLMEAQSTDYHRPKGKKGTLILNWSRKRWDSLLQPPSPSHRRC